MKTEILYEDNSILVIRKPAGLAVQSAGIGQADVVSELKSHLAKLPGAERPGKGEPYLGTGPAGGRTVGICQRQKSSSGIVEAINRRCAE